MEFVKKIFAIMKIDYKIMMQNIFAWSINKALKRNKNIALLSLLRQIVTDISDQYSNSQIEGFLELKVRAMHVFQCSLMLKAVEKIKKEAFIVVDIGDSAGTHMIYLKELTKNKFEINAIGINLDQEAVERIKSRGQKAILCRAEDLQLEEEIDLFTSFEMVEHLHNPSIFFRRLAVKSSCKKMLITVPYLKQSRVGLGYVRDILRGAA